MLDGTCSCSRVRYRMSSRPLIVHCCHCRWCQRETGSAFVINALIESDRVEILSGEVEKIHTPSESGKGQDIFRCTECHVAVWSQYAGLGDKFSFVRVGTLDDPDAVPPDVHIFTESKQPWVLLPESVPSFPIYYNAKQVWSSESQARRNAVLERQK